MSHSRHRPEPRRQTSYLSFTPRRSAIASFDNLVVLANYEEHLREARKMVWRDRGEPAVDIHDIHECLVYGVRGALRAYSFRRPLPVRNFIPCRYIGAGTIAFAIRSGVNLVLLLGRIKKLSKSVCIPCSDASHHTQTYILLGKSAYLSYGMHCSDQILSAPLPC
jgi:hypothetical protein